MSKQDKKLRKSYERSLKDHSINPDQAKQAARILAREATEGRFDRSPQEQALLDSINQQIWSS